MILEGENAVLTNRKIMGALIQKMLKQIQLENFMVFPLIKILFMDQTQQITQKKKLIFFSTVSCT